MKKIKKNDLRLEKEVISKLSQGDLTLVKGGVSTNVCMVSDQCVEPISAKPEACKTVLQNTCQLSVCGGCQTGACPTGVCVYTDKDGNCGPEVVK